MSELTLKVVVPSFDGSQPLTPAVLNALLQGIQITLEGLAGSATISDGAVTTSKIADHAVTPAKLNPSVAGGGLQQDDSAGLSIPSDGITPARVLYGNVALAGSGSTAVDWSTGLSFRTTLTDNWTVSAFTSAKAGQTILIAVQQAAAGGKTVTWTPTIKWRGGATPVLTTTANKKDAFAILFDGVDFLGNYLQNF